MNWPENNAKIIFEDNSQVKGKEIILNAQNCDKEETYKIEFNYLEKLEVGEYESYARVNINGENIGEKLILRIRIKEEEISEVKKYENIIGELRKEYDLSKDDYTDEKLLECLKKSDFKKEEAFALIFE